MERMETTRLRIEPMSDAELSSLVEQYKVIVPELSQAYSEMLENCRAFPQQYLWYTSWKICQKDTGEAIGYAGFKGISEEGSVEIGYGIDEEYEGKGYATEGVRALCEWASKQPDTTVIEAETEPDNRASMRVLEKISFHPTGTMGQEGPRFIKFVPMRRS